jgi:hypothetical protein
LLGNISSFIAQYNKCHKARHLQRGFDLIYIELTFIAPILCDVIYLDTPVPEFLLYLFVKSAFGDCFSNGHPTGHVNFVGIGTIYFGNLVMIILYKAKSFSVHAEKARGRVGK